MDTWGKNMEKDVARIESALRVACKKLEAEDITEEAIQSRIDIFRDHYKRGWLSRMDVTVICQHISSIEEEIVLWEFMLNYRQIFNK